MPNNQPIPKWTRVEVQENYNYSCAWCQSSKHLSIHHMVPRRAGGSNDPDNLILLCRACHNHADKQTLADYPV